MHVNQVFAFVVMIVAIQAVTRVALAFLNRRQPPSYQLEGRLDEITARLARIEQAVDTTAVELERVSEGQRFLTRSLVETQRRVEPVLAPGRTVTPH